MEREPARILVIDDDPLVRHGLREILATQGFEVEVAADGESGLARLKEEAFALVLTDLALPGLGGMDVLQYLVGHQPECLCIIITGFGSIGSVVEAMKKGAYDYLEKPFDLDAAMTHVQRALETTELRREMRALKAATSAPYRFACMIGQSAAMKQTKALLARVKQ